MTSEIELKQSRYCILKLESESLSSLRSELEVESPMRVGVIYFYSGSNVGQKHHNRAIAVLDFSLILESGQH